MNLYLLRHGLAVEPGTPGYARDADRPLTPEGKQKLQKIARAMKTLELEFDRIVSSPYLRARQTAEIIAERLKPCQKLELSGTLAPDGSSRKLIELLNGLEPPPKSVLLVGHEPYLSGLIALLISGHQGASIVMKKAGLASLRLASLHHGRCAELEWLLTPKQMALLV
jgi:phosphohistidine phosphatase